MELLIIRQPNVAAFTGNPMQYSIGITPYSSLQQTLPLRVVVKIELEQIYGTGQYAEIDNLVLYPNSQGMVSFDVSEKVDAYLKYFTPPLQLRTITECAEQSKRYRISYYLTNDNLVLVPSATSDVRFGIKGGTDPYLTYPSNLLANGSTLLTTAYQPDIREDLMQQGEYRFIYFLARGTLTPGAGDMPVLRAAGFDTADDAEYVHPINTFTQWRVYCIPMTPHVLFAVAPTRPRAFQFDASIIGSEALNAVLDYRPAYDHRQLMYRDSLGGLNTISLRGNIATETSYERQQASLVNFPDQYFAQRLKPAAFSTRATETTLQKGNTGFIPKWKVDSLRDLFLSPEVYEVYNNALIPIVLQNSKARLYEKGDALFNLEIEWQRANPSRFYSQPAPLLETCPLVISISCRQSSSSTLDIMWALQQPYDTVDIEIIIGAVTTPYRLQSSTGRRRISFINPAVGNDTETITIRARTVCDPYSDPNSVSGWTTISVTVTGNQGPVAQNDVVNIASGYNAPITLPINVLANDYDPDGDTLTVTAETSQPTDAGGTYSITTGGVVTYQPINSAYVGQDFFDYEVTESGGALTATARCYINVGTGSQGGFVYVRLEETNVYNTSQAYSSSSGGDRRARFYADPAGTQSINPAALGLTLNLRRTDFYQDFYGATSSNTTDTTVAVTSGDVFLFSGQWSSFLYDPFYSFDMQEIISHTIQPGTGYIVI